MSKIRGQRANARVCPQFFRTIVETLFPTQERHYNEPVNVWTKQIEETMKVRKVLEIAKMFASNKAPGRREPFLIFRGIHKMYTHRDFSENLENTETGTHIKLTNYQEKLVRTDHSV